MKRNRLKQFLKFLSYEKLSKRELITKINSLELENEILKEDIKNNIFEEVMKNYDKIQMNDKLMQEIKMLRKKNKKLKEKI